MQVQASQELSSRDGAASKGWRNARTGEMWTPFSVAWVAESAVLNL